MNVQIVWNSGFDLIEKFAELCGAMTRACAYRKSDPAILMVQSAQDRAADNASG